VKFILEGQPEPPLYFARMKRDNKMGPKILKGLPQPKHLNLNELKKLTDNTDVALLDTRERDEFSEGHVPGSLLSPLNKQFNTVAGSYITEDEEIYLIVEEHRVKEAVRDLYRIGLDNVIGFVTPTDLDHYKEQGAELETITVQKFDAIDQYVGNDDFQILDVRKASEFEEEGNLEGAQNIAHTRLLPRMEEVPIERKIVVHCQAGGRSAVAAALLQRNGYDVVLIDDEWENYKTKATASA